MSMWNTSRRDRLSCFGGIGRPPSSTRCRLTEQRCRCCSRWIWASRHRELSPQQRSRYPRVSTPGSWRCGLRRPRESITRSVAAGELGVAEYLIKKGAKTSLRDSQGWTPLARARENRDTEMIKLLLSYRSPKGCIAVCGSGQGKTPLLVSYSLPLSFLSQTISSKREFGGWMRLLVMIVGSEGASVRGTKGSREE